MVGDLHYDELSDSERSAIALPIHKLALELLERDRDLWERLFMQKPETVRDPLRKELRRLYAMGIGLGYRTKRRR
jgi:hypothetical protein